MRYIKFKPAPMLHDFVECYYSWQSGDTLVTDLVVESPPSGFCSIVFNSGSDYVLQNKKHERMAVPRNFVAGQSIYSYKLFFNGPISIVGIVFKPAALATLFNLPTYQYTALWEIIFAREINLAMRNQPNASLKQACRTDSSYLNFIMEEKGHNAPEYAKPTGFIRGKNNLEFFRMRRQPAIAFVDSTKADLRLYHEAVGGGVFRDVHQVLLVQWGHVDRHLRQIQRVKEHPLFPRGTAHASK